MAHLWFIWERIQPRMWHIVMSNSNTLWLQYPPTKESRLIKVPILNIHSVCGTQHVKESIMGMLKKLCFWLCVNIPADLETIFMIAWFELAAKFPFLFGFSMFLLLYIKKKEIKKKFWSFQFIKLCWWQYSLARSFEQLFFLWV